MTEIWRQLLYPLGLLSAIAFSSRFIIQWISSEKVKKSVVSPLFWKISLFGNVSLLIHAFIQLQFHICFVQVCNAVISWRNIDLMSPPEGRWKLSSVVYLLAASLIMITLAFALQMHYSIDSGNSWLRTPSNFLSTYGQGKTSFLWHGVGVCGLLLFNSRFWVQWWEAERKGESFLGPAFWWMSLAGAFFCAAYFLKISDWVNLMGPLFGIVPTVRNLMIIRTAT
nr:lipid-A-disaccharide synthase N-terminal domain-containing protein [Parachlamydiaceae bacterium]